MVAKRADMLPLIFQNLEKFLRFINTALNVIVKFIIKGLNTTDNGSDLHQNV